MIWGRGVEYCGGMNFTLQSYKNMSCTLKRLLWGEDVYDDRRIEVCGLRCLCQILSDSFCDLDKGESFGG